MIIGTGCKQLQRATTDVHSMRYTARAGIIAGSSDRASGTLAVAVMNDCAIGRHAGLFFLYVSKRMSTIAIIVAIRRIYVRKFRQAGATSPLTSIVPSEHGMRDSLVFRKLVREGIFVRVNAQRYYLDEHRENELAQGRRKLILLLLIILAILLLIGVVLPAFSLFGSSGFRVR